MTEKQRKTAWTVFWIYVFLLVWIILFKISLPWKIPFFRAERSVEFVPFAPRETGMRETIRETVLNFLVFIPLGAYLTAFFEGRSRRFLRVLGIGFGVSLFFEIAQFLFAIGATDVTDLIMNTAGAAFGFLLFLFLRAVFKTRAVSVLNGAGIACEAVFVTMMSVLILYNL